MKKSDSKNPKHIENTGTAGATNPEHVPATPDPAATPTVAVKDPKDGAAPTSMAAGSGGGSKGSSTVEVDDNGRSKGSNNAAGSESAGPKKSSAAGHESSRGSSATSTSRGEDHHSPIRDHKSIFVQRKTQHRDFVEAKSSQHPLRSDHHSPPGTRPQAISFAPSTVTWRHEVDDGDFDDMEDGADEIDDVLFKHDHTFDKLQEIYHHTLIGLDASDAGGVNMEPIKKLFLRLWDGIQQSHQNVLRMQRKDHEISVELSTIMSKTRTLIKLAEEDPEVGTRLRSKLESAWGLADIGEAEERKNALRIYELREDIFMLNRSINAAAKTEGQSTVVELTRLKSQFETQKTMVTAELAKLNFDLRSLFEKRQEVEDLKTNLEEKFKLLSEEEVIYHDAINREETRKEQLQDAINETIIQSEAKVIEVEELVQNLNLAERRMADVERYVQEQRAVNEEAQNELDIANNKYSKLKQEYEIQARICDRLMLDLFKRQTDLRDKEDEVIEARNMISRMTNQKQLNLKKVEESKGIVLGLEEERDVFKEKLTLLEKELETAQIKLEDNKKKVDILDRDRALLNRSLERAMSLASSHENQRVTHELAVKNLETDIDGYQREIQDQEIIISTLEKERDGYSHEAMKLAHQVAVRLEESRKLDRSIYEYQKKLGRVETALKKQQQIYENARYEKGLTQRQLRDILSDGMENSIKLMHLGHKIMGLKFQVAEKDVMIHVETARYERVLKETKFYGREGKRLKQMAFDMQRMVEALMDERFVLKKTVAAVESEMGRQLYYATAAESRTEVFFRKEMAKEQELKEICERWRILHSKVRIGNYHFRNLVTDIRRIRIQIFETKKENIVRSFGKKRVRKLEHEISVMENIISQEICMCNSLRESMRHPINVHRWRVLECEDPEAYSMVLKSNLLMRRLVERNTLIRKQDNELSYKQEIYCQIREALSKAPSLEAPENVKYYEHLVAAKERQFEMLEYELQASILHARYFEEELALLKPCFLKLLRKYFRRMRNEGKSYIFDYVENEDIFQEEEGEGDQNSRASSSDLDISRAKESIISLTNLANQLLPLVDQSQTLIGPPGGAEKQKS